MHRVSRDWEKMLSMGNRRGYLDMIHSKREARGKRKDEDPKEEETAENLGPEVKEEEGEDRRTGRTTSSRCFARSPTDGPVRECM